MIQPPDYIRGIQPYIPGKPVEELERELGIPKSIKLASNENPLGPSPAALKAIETVFSDINRYPDGSGYYLTRALSEKLGVSTSEIILGNGSNELIDIACRTFMKAGDEAVMASPSFVVYSMAVQAVGGTPVQVPLKGYTHDLSSMANAVTPKTRIVFIANPNNPTGTMNSKEEFDLFMDMIPDSILVVVDEAYFEYVSDSSYADSMKYLGSGKYVLILRTFSKIYGLAGLRIGYGMADSAVLSDMNRIREPFNTNSVAQKAALAALADSDHVVRSRWINDEGKKYLYNELQSMGVTYIPTETNFIYIPVEGARDIYEALLKKGIIIRPMGPNALRVTIGLPEENKAFVRAFKTVSGKER